MKQKLIDVLVRELPKLGGWPDKVRAISYNLAYLKWVVSVVNNSGLDDAGYKSIINVLAAIKVDGAVIIELVSREDYEAALAALDNAPSREHRTYELHIGAPIQPSWNGEGLPPVGTVCEYTKPSLTEWTQCTIDYVGASFVVYRDCCGIELSGIIGNIAFRPLRSAVAAKRERMAASLHKAAGAIPGSIGPLYFVLADAIISGAIDDVFVREGE